MLSPPAVISPFYSGVLTLNQFLRYEMHDQFSLLSAGLIAAILGGKKKQTTNTQATNKN